MVAALILAGLNPASGFQQPDQPELANFDKRARTAARNVEADESRRAALAHLKSRLPKAKLDWDEVIGSPAWIRSTESFLSGPNGEGGGIAAQTARKFDARERHAAIKAFIDDHRALFGHGPEALDQALLAREFTTPHNGLRTVVWRQHLDNIPVFDGLFTGHTTRHGELVSLCGRFVPDLVQAADRGVRNRAALEADPVISATQAVLRAARNIEEELTIEQVTEKPSHSDRPAVRVFVAAPVLNGETEVRMVWLPIERSSMRLCWEVLLTSRKRGETFRVILDAETGEALLRHCLTVYLSNASYRVFTSDSPTPFSPGLQSPATNQPAEVARELITIDALDRTASPNGWINDGDNQTIGNNVDAHLDWDADNVADTPRPQGSPNRVFDFPLDLTKSPAAYSNAAVVQLFYWCNWMHDRLYQLGFTEAAGNFQTTNFNRGGSENDAVLADAQDGSGFNNANFTPAADGTPGRLQMFIWNGPTPARDGDFDAEVVLHEYTHGLSNRRVGGAGGVGPGITEIQSKSLGEGWSDFYGLAMLSASSDDVDAAYARGAYSRFMMNGTFTQNYYYGGRRYPYTTDLNRNPLTFKDIDPAQASAHSTIPSNPSVSSPSAIEVHNQGEVWCITLWEARANIIKRCGFDRGNELTLRLVTDGMNLAPANPNFLQARDAILLADAVNQNKANYVDLWTAFAKRGMGAMATNSPSSSTTIAVQEDFTLPRDILFVDKSYTGGSPNGSRTAPYPTVLQAYDVALPGYVIRIRNGTYPEALSFTKNLYLQAENGPAAVGTP